MADNFLKISSGINLIGQAVAPANPINGDLYYDSVGQTFKGYAAGVYIDVGMSIGGAITGPATAGSILFAGVGGILAQDNAQLFWDDTNNRLGIGTATPSAQLQVSNGTDTVFVNGLFGSLAIDTNNTTKNGLEVYVNSAINNKAAIYTMTSGTGQAILAETYGTGAAAKLYTADAAATHLKFQNADSNEVGLKIPFTGVTDYDLTLPSIQGSANTVLKNDGSGNLSWSNSMSIGDTISTATAGSVLFAGTTGILAQDNTQLFWDDTNNRLGVGTATPVGKLDIRGTSDVSQLIVRAHTTQNPYVFSTFSSANVQVFGITDGGSFQRPAAAAGDLNIANMSGDSVTVNAGGLEVIRFEGYGTGNVGIGTTTPNEQLEITKSFRIPATTATDGIIKQGANRFIHSFGAGTSNIFAGQNAGNLTNTTGGATGIGALALTSISSGTGNTAVGYSALNAVSTGSDNTAVGGSALASSTSSSNTAVGSFALFAQTTGAGNTAVGNFTLAANTTGDNNIASGGSALLANTTGAQNTANGWGALQSNTTGNVNTAIGYNTGGGITTGSYNTILGANVAGLSNPSNNIILADGAGNIKARNDGTDWNLTGNVGIGTATPAAKLHISAATSNPLLRLTDTVDGQLLNVIYDGYAVNLEASGDPVQLYGAAYFAVSNPTILGQSLAANKGSQPIAINIGTQDYATVGTPLTGERMQFNTWAWNGANGYTINSQAEIQMTQLSAATDDARLDITTNTTPIPRISILSNGNVGIGTTTPTSKLSVGASSEFQVNSTGDIVKINNVVTSFPAAQGAASTFLQNNGSGVLSWAAATDATKLPLAGGTMTGAILGALGTVTAPGYSFSGDTNTGVWSSGADTVNISTAGAERLKIDSTGVVRIDRALDFLDFHLSGNVIDIYTDTGSNSAPFVSYIGDSASTAIGIYSGTEGVQPAIQGDANSSGPAISARRGNSGTGPNIELLNGADGTSINIRIPTSGITTHDLTLPATQGAASTFLQNNGSGVLSWATASASPYTQKTTTYTAVAYDKILADSSGGSFTITLPAAPTVGESVMIMDGGGSFTTNPVTVDRNSLNIQGAAANYTLNIDNGWAEFVYNGVTRGWEVRT